LLKSVAKAVTSLNTLGKSEVFDGRLFCTLKRIQKFSKKNTRSNRLILLGFQKVFQKNALFLKRPYNVFATHCVYANRNPLEIF